MNFPPRVRVVHSPFDRYDERVYFVDGLDLDPAVEEVWVVSSPLEPVDRTVLAVTNPLEFGVRRVRRATTPTGSAFGGSSAPPWDRIDDAILYAIWLFFLAVAVIVLLVAFELGGWLLLGLCLALVFGYLFVVLTGQ